MIHSFDYQGVPYTVLAHRVTIGWWDATVTFEMLPVIRSEDEPFRTESEAVVWGERVGRTALS